MEGGTDGNERLTSMAGAILIVLLAVLGVTILRIGQLIWVHLFVGSRQQLLTLHKVSFIVWLAFTSLHLLGYRHDFCARSAPPASTAS